MFVIVLGCYMWCHKRKRSFATFLQWNTSFQTNISKANQTKSRNRQLQTHVHTVLQHSCRAENADTVCVSEPLSHIWLQLGLYNSSRCSWNESTDKDTDKDTGKDTDKDWGRQFCSRRTRRRVQRGVDLSLTMSSANKTTIPIFVVDTFADKPFHGNQSPVCVLPQDMVRFCLPASLSVCLCLSVCLSVCLSLSLCTVWLWMCESLKWWKIFLLLTDCDFMNQ